MMNPKIKSRTIVILLALAAISTASIYIFQNEVSAAGLKGKIYAATFDGQSENQFSSKDAVYLAGGPQNANHAPPDGTYYFQVTDPSGNTLLSTDLAVCRQLVIFNGKIAAADGPSCQHATGIPESADGSTPVKLMPFADTPNNGDVYKAWLIQQGAGTTVAADGKHINFNNQNSIKENFKASSASCTNCSPTSLLGGRKFYDANANAIFDQGEAPVEGVQILILANGNPTVVTTNAAGVWGTSVPTGSEYVVFEFLPFTGPDGEPGSYWQQTAPTANNEGFQGYQGTATADQTNLNFGNICFSPDSQGNPVAQPMPCPVSDLPPPDPDPTPTPTPCPDCNPAAVLSGKKFYDSNRNASFDVGEVPVAGVQILVILTTGDGTTLTYTTTDALGDWSLTVPAGAQYLITEDQPFADPVLEPGAYWEQTAPLPNDEGFRGYSGTVSVDQGGFNFGNVCFHEGNPSPSMTPCTVWYPPSPTSTPTPTPDQ